MLLALFVAYWWGFLSGIYWERGAKRLPIRARRDSVELENLKTLENVRSDDGGHDCH